MMKKRFFNMIEVCLAIGVMAVGVIGAVAILPSAMKTSQNASNDVYLADAANIIFAQIDREVKRIQIEYDESRQKNIANGSSATGDQRLKDEFADLLAKTATVDDTPNVCNGTIWSRNNVFTSGELFTSQEISTEGSAVRVFFKKAAGASFGRISFYHVPADWNEEIDDGNKGNMQDSYSGRFNRNPKGLQPIFRAMVRVFSTSIDHDPSQDQSSKKSAAIRKHTRIPAQWNVVDYEVNGKPFKGLFRLDSTNVAAINMSVNDRADCWRRVYVEFSYPANLPLNRRTRKIFVKEYYLMD